MFPFHYTILVMCVGTSKMMYNAMGGQKLSKGSVFSSPIRLYTFDFGVELKFNHSFKLLKYSKGINFRL